MNSEIMEFSGVFLLLYGRFGVSVELLLVLSRHAALIPTVAELDRDFANGGIQLEAKESFRCSVSTTQHVPRDGHPMHFGLRWWQSRALRKPAKRLARLT
jgi:hypothetical protein